VNTQILPKFVFVLSLIVALAACAGEDGPEGPQGSTGEQGPPGPEGPATLVETEPIEDGDECEAGGVRINTGVDTDGDGALSDEEIDAGSSTVVCNSSDTASCPGPIEITDITGLDQTFYEGIESDPIQLVIDGEGSIDLTVVGGAFGFEPSAVVGEFSLVPREVGGPFELAIIANNGCSIDVASFEVDEVQPAVSTVRLMHAYQPRDQLALAFQNDPEMLAEASYGSASPPFEVEPDTHKFDIISDDLLIDTTPFIDLDLGESYTLVAYEASPGRIDVLRLEDDLSEVHPDVRLRAVNVDPDVPTFDLLELHPDDTTSPLYDSLTFAQASDTTTVSANMFGLAIDRDGDGSADEDLPYGDDVLSAGLVGNLFAIPSAGNSVMMVLQPLVDEGGAIAVSGVSGLPESFEGATLPALVTTGGDADWTIDDTQASDGASSAASGFITHSETTWMELEVDFPSTGEFSFDWMVSSESGFDYLLFCTSAANSCTRSTYDERISGSVAWTTVQVTIDSPGPHTFGWAYSKDGSVSSGDDLGRVDNLRFVAE
jgi:hypothetical protein